MERTHVFIPTPARADLKRLSTATGLTVAEHIRRAISDYLEKRMSQLEPDNPQRRP